VASGPLRGRIRPPPTHRDDSLSRIRERVMRRPSLSRVWEIHEHGLKGGFRSPGSQEHRA
jgi:hypothetical protein